MVTTSTLTENATTGVIASGKTTIVTDKNTCQVQSQNQSKDNKHRKTEAVSTMSAVVDHGSNSTPENDHRRNTNTNVNSSYVSSCSDSSSQSLEEEEELTEPEQEIVEKDTIANSVKYTIDSPCVNRVETSTPIPPITPVENNSPTFTKQQIKDKEGDNSKNKNISSAQNKSKDEEKRDDTHENENEINEKELVEEEEEDEDLQHLTNRVKSLEAQLETFQKLLANVMEMQHSDNTSNVVRF